MAKGILVFNQKGGSCKTTTALEIYYSFVREFAGTNRHVSYVDLDTQDGDQSKIVDDAEVSVIDTPGALISDLSDLIETADCIVIPTRMTARDLPVLQSMMALADARATGPILYVLSCWNRFNATRAFQEAFDEFHVEHFCIIPQSEGFAQASAYDCSIVDVYPHSSFPVQATISMVNNVRRLIGYPEEKLK